MWTLSEAAREYILPRFPKIPLDNIHYDKDQRGYEGATATVFPAKLRTVNGSHTNVAIKKYNDLVDRRDDLKVRNTAK